MLGDGFRFEGAWKYEGVHTWASGTRYEGAWKDGKRHGQGVHTGPDGTRYAGAYEDGKPDGPGPCSDTHLTLPTNYPPLNSVGGQTAKNTHHRPEPKPPPDN